MSRLNDFGKAFSANPEETFSLSLDEALRSLADGLAKDLLIAELLLGTEGAGADPFADTASEIDVILSRHFGAMKGEIREALRKKLEGMEKAAGRLSNIPD